MFDSERLGLVGRTDGEVHRNILRDTKYVYYRKYILFSKSYDTSYFLCCEKITPCSLGMCIARWALYGRIPL